LHHITITRQGKYFVVHYGCQSFFYITKEAMMAEIGNYVDNFVDVDQAYQAFQFGNKPQIDRTPPPTQGMAVPIGETMSAGGQAFAPQEAAGAQRV
jgi:hypothetical protein